MMGIEAPAAAVPWRYVPSRFCHFLAALEPPPAERAAIAAAAHQVSDLLYRRFRRPQPPHRFRQELPGRIDTIGSYAKGTAIAGSLTIDLAVIIGGRPEISPSGGTKPGEVVIRQLTDQLGERYGAVRVVPPGWLVVDVRLPQVSEHIRVRTLPAFACPTGGFVVGTASRMAGSACWRHLDPVAERLQLHRVDRLTEGKARHLIRIAKAWKRALAVPLSGFALELLVAEFLGVWLYRRRSLLFYDWMVRDFFFWLAAQGGRALPLPGSLDVLSLGRAWVEAAEAAYAAAAAAADLERENNSVVALAHWRRIFGLAIAPRTAMTPAVAAPLPAAAARLALPAVP